MTATVLCRFVVEARAQPQGSKRAFAHKQTGKIIVADANPKGKRFKQQVAWTAKAAWGRPPVAAHVPLVLDVRVEWQRPRSHLLASGGLSAEGRKYPEPTMRPDTTKLIRACEDALTGVIWTDDAQITEQHASKSWGSSDRVIITITRLAIGAQTRQEELWQTR